MLKINKILVSRINWSIFGCTLALLTGDIIIQTAHSQSNNGGRNCSPSQFRCFNGQCIPKFDICDGMKNCFDGSDETHATCLKYNITCPNGAFRCAYGGCVDSYAECDGKSDCADDSDELSIICPGVGAVDGNHPQCSSNQFQCRNGQCIDRYSKCDGRIDCYDGSDETITSCNHPSFNCPSYTFRCAYGGCVSAHARCNGVADCADSSDEDDVLCGRSPSNRPTTKKPPPKPPGTMRPPTPRPTTQRVTTQRPTTIQTVRTTLRNPVADVMTISPPSRIPPDKCLIPASSGTMYSDKPCNNVDNCEELQSNKMVDSIFVMFMYCRTGYGQPHDNTNIVVCTNGKWQPREITCLKFCQPITSTTLISQCSYNGKDVECSSMMRPGTQARSDCNVGYIPLVPITYYDIYCKGNGEWDNPPPRCSHDCGVLNTQGGLIQDGEDAVKTDHPWSAAVYRIMKNSTFSQVCGGTLVTPYAVLSAAHCTHSYRGGKLPASNFMIGLSKLFRDYYSQQDGSAQLLQVEEIHIPIVYHPLSLNYLFDIAIFELKTVAQLNRFVMPVCMDLKGKYQLHSSLFGTVVGWGLDSTGFSTVTLQKAKFPYINRDECIRNLRTDEKEMITKDKFCTYYKNGTTTTLRKGDSGAGIIFEFEGRNYIYGIVSTNLYKNMVTFTDIRFESHVDFIGRILRDITNKHS